MNGKRRGPVAIAVRAALSVASFPYRLAVWQRNRSFDNGRRTIHRCEIPVISVGNLTTGGTGKTPVVAYLAQWFRERNVRVAIVSRGYGRGDADENDEAAELHQRLPDVPHVQDPDRVAAARIAVDELDSQLILMDDGFQHRRLGRELDFVLVDMTCPFGYGALLPRGLLREPVESLARADAVVLTRCDQVDPSEVDAVVGQIRSVRREIPILRSTHRPSALLQYPSNRVPVESIRGKRVALISGIGNPAAFFRTVQDVGAVPVDHQTLADHAAYDPETVRQLVQWCRSLRDVDCLLCTQKDLVKLRTDRLAGLDLYALLIEAEFEQPESLDPLLQRVADQIDDDECIIQG